MYFEKPGKQNTQETVNIALQAAKELGIDTIVVATNTGDTADLLKDAARSGLHVVAVSHCFGFKDPEVQEMPAERKAALEAAGIQVYTATHVLSGAERGLSAKFGGISPIEVMAYSLRMLGPGHQSGGGVFGDGAGRRDDPLSKTRHRHRRNRPRRRHRSGAAGRPRR